MADGERRKLVLTEEDLGGAPTSEPAVPATPSLWKDPAQQHAAPPVTEVHAPPSPPQAPPPRAALPQPPPQEFPTVSGVGAAPRVVTPGPAPGLSATAPAWLNTNTVLGRSLVAAAVGILLGWAVTEILDIGQWSTTSKLGLNLNAAAFVGTLGLIFAIVYGGWEHILARSGEGLLHVAKTSGPVGAGLGFVSGFFAQVVFSALVTKIIESGGFGGDVTGDVRLYLARALAWGLFGMGMGAATAVLVRSSKKLVNGLIGGAIGGALGGLVFHFLALHVHSEVFSRLVGLLIIGAGIGVAIGLIETARREAWLNVVAGGMTGKEFIIYAAETKVGSTPKCEIVLIKDPAIQPYHFVITTPPGPGHQRRTLTAYQGCTVTIQGQPVAQHTLRDGDVIGVGSTAIRYAERAVSQPSPTI